MLKLESVRSTFIAALASATLAGCGSSESKPPPVTASEANERMQPAARTEPARTRATPPPAETKAEDDGSIGVVVIEEGLREKCGLENPATYFAFDSARLQGTTEYALQQLANCFIGGPMAGEQLLLVGHADPRGGSEYNMALGGRRAGSVAEALIQFGLSPDRIQTSSRGEMDANGTEPASWALDRRVEILAR